MIRIQPTTANVTRMLIGSDLPDAEAARLEVEEWVEQNNWSLPEDARQLTVFENGVAVREWLLVERPMTTVIVAPEPDQSGLVPFWRNIGAKSGTGRSLDRDNTITLYPAAA